jgi:hypothetical protein
MKRNFAMNVTNRTMNTEVTIEGDSTRANDLGVPGLRGVYRDIADLPYIREDHSSMWQMLFKGDLSEFFLRDHYTIPASLPSIVRFPRVIRMIWDADLRGRADLSLFYMRCLEKKLNSIGGDGNEQVCPEWLSDSKDDDDSDDPEPVLKRIKVESTGFVCEYCNLPFNCKSLLDDHVRRHKPFPCLVCDKRFSTSGILKAHALVHTRARV